MSQRVRVRFAPSPTGYLHVGGARTALYNYLFARKHQGDFLLRIEDTDEARSTEESLRMQIADLKWLGLKWDEGPHPDTLADIGPCGPYRQSHRKSIYHEYARKLLAQGSAFYCFMTDEEVEKKREELKAAGLPLQVNSPYRDLPLKEAEARIAKGESAVIRFRVPDTREPYVHQDLVRGQVTWPPEMVSDFVIVRAGGMPVYNYVCAIDDALMKITHVFRAEEHLNNTIKQLLILKALQMPIPQYGHLSIILGEDKQKLSKRHGATSCHEYHENGFLPEALNNFIALLGWSDPEGRELMSMDEMTAAFSADRLNPASAVFDEKKLRWMNSMHLRGLPHGELWARVEPYLKQAGLSLPADPAWQDQALGTFKSYMETLKDAVELFRPLDNASFAIHDEAKETLSWESTRLVFQKWIEILKGFSGTSLSEVDFEKAQNQIKDECQVKGKFLFMPIRVAIIGKPHGAELKILVPLMTKQQLLDRAQVALASLK